MRKVGFILTLAVSTAVFASGCRINCKRATQELMTPTVNVMAYLNTNPSGQQLAENGCSLILGQFAKVPRGTERVRRLAENRWSHSRSYCLDWRTSYHYRCDHWRYIRCQWEPYTYCVQWQTDIIREPGYALAVELSKDLDAMYDKAHRLCGQAAAGHYEEAYRMSREFLEFLATEVKPEGDQVYGMACGR